ncbi:uncharacterized protein SOCE26_083030 [Sorangium cellulosum]|uniref:Uncharacterized protein n=1 Tax=Sorangium cellulosum TaxID=56 RepID=A0A2L0F5E0_SORCE|nr:hypothetical protein [Sorangium cellulosum]AUX46794.1 uncharacterized protein SOCE26_083030 [Sorangium cellulosum]
MSVATSVRVLRGGTIVAAAAMCLVACERPSPSAGSGAPAGSSAANGAPPSVAARPEMAVLGADERRVPLLVVPGDALVEVDGQPAYRRNGAIDLTGKVGDVRRVRVWKGAKAAPEKAVTIQETQPSPPLVDLNEAPPPRPAAKAPKRPARFGGFDDG